MAASKMPQGEEGLKSIESILAKVLADQAQEPARTEVDLAFVIPKSNANWADEEKRKATEKLGHKFNEMKNPNEVEFIAMRGKEVPFSVIGSGKRHIRIAKVKRGSEGSRLGVAVRIVRKGNQLVEPYQPFVNRKAEPGEEETVHLVNDGEECLIVEAKEDGSYVIDKITNRWKGNKPEPSRKRFLAGSEQAPKGSEWLTPLIMEAFEDLRRS